MDKKDVTVQRVANKYVTELKATQHPKLWRAFWKIEGSILAKKVGKR